MIMTSKVNFIKDSSYARLLQRTLFAFFILFFYFSGICQEYATIYVYRKKKLTSTGIDFKIYLNKLEIGQIYNGGRLEYRYYKTGRVSIMCGVFSEYGGTDKYEDNITLDIQKGKSYYLKGEGKRLFIVSEELGKLEFERNEDFKGGVALNDDKPWPGTVSTEAETPKESAPVKKEITEVTKPEIVLLVPKLTDDELKTGAATMKFAGYATSESKIKSVKINGEVFPSDELGNFSTQLKLKEGLNRISIVILNQKGQSAEKIIKVIREVEEDLAVAKTPAESEEVTYRGSDPFKGTNVANASKELKVGKYYALFIGIDNYTGAWQPLKNAVNDAKAIETILRTNYKTDVVKTLYNSQATRTNIINELEWLVANVKENDNVMIYYSGHGELKKELNKGYWVPADAKGVSTSQFISNSEIQTFLAGIPSRHTLLVSDACFSGDIFRGTVTSLPAENSEKYYVKTYHPK